MFRSSLENEADVTALADCLRSVSIGETVSLTQLSDAIGRPIARRRDLLYRALNMLSRDHGIVFGNVRMVGYRRLPIEAIPTLGLRARRAIRRKAGRGIKIIQNAAEHANDVPNETSIAIGRELSVLGHLRAASRDTLVAKVVAGITTATVEPTAKMAKRFLDAFQS